MLNLKTVVTDGTKDYLVSTVLLLYPIAHEAGFETLVFPQGEDGEWDSSHDVLCALYDNEREAILGHERVVALYGGEKP